MELRWSRRGHRLFRQFLSHPSKGRAIAYDQLQPTLVASHNLSAGRPCERRDPSPLASKVKRGLCSSAETSVRAAAMSAIALTLGSLRSQGRLIENSICDSPALVERDEEAVTPPRRSTTPECLFARAGDFRPRRTPPTAGR